MKVTRKEAKESLIRGANNKKHICETLRLIYDEVYATEITDQNAYSLKEMEKLLIDAMMMAKKMQQRLSYYQKKYKDNTGNKGKHIGLTGVRSKSKMRKARII